MKPVWQRSATLLAGLFVTALYAMPQAYTISARPGALNYVEGHAFLNGHAVSEKSLRAVFLNANDTLSTDVGKAEVLLTPGVFLRIGDNSAVKMISPSLTATQVEVTRGEAMVESAGLMKENDIQILDQNGSIRIEKDGLYRFVAGNPGTAAVIEGKAEVSFGGKTVDLSKNHEAAMETPLKSEKFNAKQADDLYAWSNVRAEYGAAASYQSAQNVSVNSWGGGWGGGWGGYGFTGFAGPGWFWNNGFNSWAWLPGSGAFYSPFGWGFYSPGVIGYAPVIAAPVYVGTTGNKPVGTKPVAVNPQNPPALAMVRSGSPAAYESARAMAVRSYGATGFPTSSGYHVAAGRAAFGSAGAGGAHAAMSGGGVAHASAAPSGGFGGGGHASAGGGGGHR